MDLRKQESGAAIVEFALVSMMLLMLVFGIVEFGRVFHAKLVITSAAREAARVAAVHKPDEDIKLVIQNTVQSLVASESVIEKTYSMIDSSEPASNQIFFAIDPGTRPAESGGNVKVVVKGAVDIVVPVISNILGPKKVLYSSAQMRLE